MHSTRPLSDPKSILGQVRAFTRRLRRDRGFGPDDRDDLAQELLLRLYLRDALSDLLFPPEAMARILRQGLANHFRSRHRRKHRPPGAVVFLSVLEPFADGHPTDPAGENAARMDFELDWQVILAPFRRREVALIDRWRANDWRRPKGLSKRQRKRFAAVRRKLADRLAELGYRPGGDRP